ncbi:retron system putative HNH endonuclease [Shewanella sp. NKUCC06_TVS]|uniref:retron system putative HNH endonuclease n=1 Tax=Shewanella sp. NKUCC06_TVS TaxID=2842128 RepID=UPI001C5BE51B|nr:retron system putative HNH endonuclease [Shewanella sp. NKUCC06_TVS]MBW3533439.1 TIGR02646 family protein [Shewanella sp. NKUCC06_TVS]
MKYIIKSANAALDHLNKTPPQDTLEARTRWQRIKSKTKNETRKKCCAEQFGLCGYSEVALLKANFTNFTDLGAHLEHVEPKSKVPQRTFDHKNLILCAIDTNDQKNITKGDIFGGHYKDDWHEPNDFINPFMVDCSSYFHFENDGRIKPSIHRSVFEQCKAQITIDRLNLNSPTLVVWRKNWYEEISDDIDKHLDPYDQVGLAKLKDMTLMQNNGLLPPFYSMLKQLFN